VTFDTKIAIVVREDLAVWQKLNVTAFLAGGLAGNDRRVVGSAYVDGSERTYLPLIVQPVVVLAADADGIRKAYERAMSRSIPIGIYTEDLFATSNDVDNRAAVRKVPSSDLRLVGIALRAPKREVDQVTKGLRLHA
jgi:hypothetical protein